MRISDWSSDVCSSDLRPAAAGAFDLVEPRREPGGQAGHLRGEILALAGIARQIIELMPRQRADRVAVELMRFRAAANELPVAGAQRENARAAARDGRARRDHQLGILRSEEHTSELPSLMRIS